MILGEQFQYGFAVVLEQHSFHVPPDAAEAHAHARGDLRTSQTFPEKQEDLFPARGKTKRGYGLRLHGLLVYPHNFTNAVRAEFFANMRKMVAKRLFGYEQSLNDGF